MSSDAPATQIVGPAYLTTIQGVCKIVEVVLSFIAVLLVGIDFRGSVISFFESAAAFSIIIGVFFLVIYATALVAKLPLPWNKIQFFLHVILALYYIIAIGVLLHHGKDFSKIIAGGVLALIAVIAHLLDGLDNYRKQPLC